MRPVHPPSADGVGLNNLALIVLQEVGEGSVQHSWQPHRQRGCMLLCVYALSTCLNPDHPHVLVIHKLVPQQD